MRKEGNVLLLRNTQKEVNKSNKTGTCLFNIHLGITLLQKTEKSIFIQKYNIRSFYPVIR